MAKPLKPLDIQVLGLRELHSALNDLKPAVAKLVVREALRKAGAPVVQTAQTLVPFDFGKLYESIAIRPRLSKGQRRRAGRRLPGTEEYFIGASWPKGAHGHLLEFGTSKMSARPFLRPAWDQHKAKVLDDLKDYMWASIQRRAKLAARKARRVA